MHQDDVYKDHIEKLRSLENCDREVAKSIGVIEAMLARNDERVTTLFKRVGKLEDLIANIHELTASVQNLAEHNAKVLAVIEKHDEKIRDLEMRPGVIAIRAWVFVVATIASVVLGVVIGGVLRG